MSLHIKLVFFLSLGLLLIFGWHFATVFGVFGEPPETRGEFFIRIGLILAAFLLSSFIASALVARHDEQAIQPDEREEKIELKAERNGIIITYLGLLFLMWFIFNPMTPMQVANGILAIVCISELFKLASTMYYLHKGA